MKTWFITGVSTGLGLALAERVLATGDRVVGTLRSPDAKASFERRAHGTGVLLDVRDESAVHATITDIDKTTPIDVLVNNAGLAADLLHRRAPRQGLPRRSTPSRFVKS